MTAPIPTQYPRPSMPITPKMQDRIRAEGWRPPARVIETVDELEALPEMVVITAPQWRGGEALTKWSTERDYWAAPGTVTCIPSHYIPLPATVLWTPDVDA
jgi:hypothetical protein